MSSSQVMTFLHFRIKTTPLSIGTLRGSGESTSQLFRTPSSPLQRPKSNLTRFQLATRQLKSLARKQRSVERMMERYSRQLVLQRDSASSAHEESCTRLHLHCPCNNHNHCCQFLKMAHSPIKNAAKTKTPTQQLMKLQSCAMHTAISLQLMTRSHSSKPSADLTATSGGQR